MTDKIYLGIMGAPGIGKGTVMQIITENSDYIRAFLGQSSYSIYLARKYTTRPSRDGETDKVGNQPEAIVREMIGSYQLMEKHWYGYPEAELDANADLIIFEPSIYQIEQIKERLNNVFVIGLIKDRELRERGLRLRVQKGDTTMDEAEIQKRLDEGDKQADEIINAHVTGLVDSVWNLDESTWSEDPIHEGRLRQMVFEYLKTIYEI